MYFFFFLISIGIDFANPKLGPISSSDVKVIEITHISGVNGKGLLHTIVTPITFLVSKVNYLKLDYCFSKLKVVVRACCGAYSVAHVLKYLVPNFVFGRPA